MIKLNKTNGCPKKTTIWSLKRTIVLLVLAIIVTVLSSCNKTTVTMVYSEVDSLGNTMYYEKKPEKVVVLQASIADVWSLSGGTYIGVSSEYTDYGLELGSASIVGTVKHPSLETVVSLGPDLVIYSPDIEGQSSVASSLKDMGISAFAAKIDSFNDYLFCLKAFTNINENSLAYTEKGTVVDGKIKDIISSVPEGTSPTVLFIRAYSSGYKAKAYENLVCDILDDLKATNIAKSDNSLLEDLNLEVVLKDDPDYVMIVYMGQNDTEKTTKLLEDELYSQDAWKSLKAVKNNRVYILPVDLFHFKPNDRWAESYQYIYDILYKSGK